MERPLTVTSQIAYCGLPLRLDSYRGCQFGCRYCFARTRGGEFQGEGPIQGASHNSLENIFRRAERSEPDKQSMLGQFLRRRTPLHFGGMSDPFQPIEKKQRVTLAMMESLAARNYPTVISTRGTMIADPEYLRLLAGHTVVQVSLSTTHDDLARVVEPNSPRPSEMIHLINTLSTAGVKVTCRWQPYIPGLSEAPQEFIARVAEAGATHVGLEHLKVPLEGSPRWQALTRGLKRDLRREWVLEGGRRDGREYVLPAEKKLPTILAARSAAARCRVTFGAADNDFQFLSDTDCCCSGVDQFDGFDGWFKHQIGYAVRRSRGKQITYGAISREWRPKGSIDRFLNSKSRLGTRFGSEGDLKDHVRRRWNNPNSPDSPATFHGVSPTGRFTRGGYRVYEWASEAVDCDSGHVTFGSRPSGS